jgi:regulator of sigma E protease
MNFLLAPALFTIGALVSDEVSAAIAEVAIGSPAERAGLMAGDQIISIGDVDVSGVRSVIEVLSASAGSEIPVEILRGETTRTIRATPRTHPPPGQGALGIRIQPVLESAPLPLAIARGFERTVLALGLFPLAIGEWVSGKETVQLSGPVGIATVVDKAARQGIESVLFVGAFLSAQIGLINLVPWPGLDGGRLAVVGFEWLTGRRLKPRREAAFHFVGIMLLLTLAVFVTIGDVQRLFSP